MLIYEKIAVKHCKNRERKLLEQIGVLKDGQIYDLQTVEALNIQGEKIVADDSKKL